MKINDIYRGNLLGTEGSDAFERWGSQIAGSSILTESQEKRTFICLRISREWTIDCKIFFPLSFRIYWISEPVKLFKVKCSMKLSFKFKVGSSCGCMVPKSFGKFFFSMLLLIVFIIQNKHLLLKFNWNSCSLLLFYKIQIGCFLCERNFGVVACY